MMAAAVVAPAPGCFLSHENSGGDVGDVIARDGGAGDVAQRVPDGDGMDGGYGRGLDGGEQMSGDSAAAGTGGDGGPGDGETEGVARGAYPGPCVEEVDYEDDGTVNRLVFHTYDDDGLPAYTEYDDLTDSMVDGFRTYTYDDDGLLIYEEYHYGTDGVDTLTTYIYDENGRLLKEETDNGGDGAVDAITIFFYDEDGQLLTREHDTDADGTVEMIDAYTYDEEGLLQGKETHLTSESEPNFFEVCDYTHSDDGDLVQYECRFHPFDLPSGSGVHEYDENGNRTSSRVTWLSLNTTPLRPPPTYLSVSFHAYTYDCWRWSGDRWVFTGHQSE
jgi:hypothetical protein